MTDRVPNNCDVVLTEPPRKVAGFEDDEATLDFVRRFFRKMRLMVLTRKTAISEHADGRMADSVYEWTIFAGGPRAHAGKEKGEVTITKDLERDFSLVVKHPAMFRALLPVLAKRFPC
jgi:hypothetical protein